MDIIAYTVTGEGIDKRRNKGMNGYVSKEITIYGKHYTVSKDMILQAAENLKASGEIGVVGKYYVSISGVNLSCTRLLAESIGAMLIEINGQIAFRVLADLGFRILQKKRKSPIIGEKE